MKNDVPVPVMIAAIAIVVLIVGIIGYKVVVGAGHQKHDAMHVTPHNWARPPGQNNPGGGGSPATGGT